MLDCVRRARLLWEDNFNNQIQQLLFNFPADQTTTAGQLFWSGPKRCPRALAYSREDPLSNDFIFCAANLRAEMYGIERNLDRDYIATMAASIQVREFRPRSGVRIAVTENEAQTLAGHADANRVEELKKSIPSAEKLRGLIITPIEFEKDSDTNLHIDFIVAASNSRATNYQITPADRLKSKLIAGKIIPAVATTTSVVSGLVSIELYKLALGYAELKKVDRFKNGFINLALPFFTFSDPIEAHKNKYYDTEWNLWDRFEIEGEMTLQQFIDHFKDTYGLEITMLSQGVCMLYSFFMAADKRKERLALPLCEVVRRVSKRRLEPHVRALVFEVCCNDRDGEDVEVPYVRYLIPPSQLAQQQQQ